MKYDSIFEINLTNRLISTFRDPELQKHTKRNRKKYPYILVRVTLKTEQEETLFTNAPNIITNHQQN